MKVGGGTKEQTGICTSCAGTKFLTSKRIDITTCSATDTTFDPDTYSELANSCCLNIRTFTYLQNLDFVRDSSIEINVV